MRTVKSKRWWASYSVRTPKFIGRHALRLPNYEQQDYHSCGFLAALTVARFYDPLVEDQTVLEAVRPLEGSGTSQRKVVQGLGSLGIIPRYRDDLLVEDLMDYIERDVPVIISVWPDGWHGDHWTVVQGFADGRVHLTNHKVLPLDLFWRQWVENWEDDSETGAGLVCTRGLRGLR